MFFALCRSLSQFLSPAIFPSLCICMFSVIVIVSACFLLDCTFGSTSPPEPHSFCIFQQNLHMLEPKTAFKVFQCSYEAETQNIRQIVTDSNISIKRTFPGLFLGHYDLTLTQVKLVMSLLRNEDTVYVK